LIRSHGGRSECARVRHELPFHLEHESSPIDSLRIASHLASCERCSEEANRGRSLLAALRQMDEPEPGRDIASDVLAALHRVRSSLGAGAALKWSCLGILLAAIVGPGLFPDATVRLGVRLVTQLGEIVDTEAILSVLLSLVPDFLPSLTTALESFGDSARMPGAAPSLILLVVLPLLLVAAGVVFAFLSGGLVLTASRTPRPTADFDDRRRVPRFDNPPGLP
jgi:hypothetical protein